MDPLMEEPLSRQEVAEKVQQYERFLNEKLRADLRLVLEQRDALYTDIAEYNKLAAVIKTIKEAQPQMEDRKLQTKVDLGCSFFCQAEVANPTMISVGIGYGFFVEFTLDEATAFIEKRVPLLDSQAEEKTATASAIKARIKVVLEGLRELQSLDTIGHEEDTSRNF
eukprot:m.186735 g.186735  ORF g.186735 m.186735 type:complete len:167 (+) comp15059_c0_seq1:56-556(+)